MSVEEIAFQYSVIQFTYTMLAIFSLIGLGFLIGRMKK